MKFKKVHLNFPEKGLVVVTGHNLASGGALQSVGSGKTGFGEAICHTLLGVSSHFDRVGDYSMDQKGDTYVCLEADFMGKPLKVEMGYKCKELSRTGEALQYSYDGAKPISRGRIEQTRADLVKMLGVPQLLASWTVFVDGDNLKFNKLPQASSVELVMTALRQPPWSEYYENSKKVLGKFKQVAATDEASHTAAKERAENLDQDIAEAQEDLDTEQSDYDTRKAKNDAVLKEYQDKINAINAQVSKAQKEREAIAVKIEGIISKKATASKKLEVERNTIVDRIRVTKTTMRPMVRERDVAMGVYADAANAFKSYKSSAKICPTCKQAVTKPLDPARLIALEEAEVAAKKIVDGIESKYASLDESLKQDEELLEKNRLATVELGAEEAVSELSEKDEDLETGISNDQAQAHRYELTLTQAKAGVSNEKLKQAEATLAERKRQLKQANADVDKIATEMANNVAMLKGLEYWNTAFSPYGIPNMVLREAIAPLNREAKRVSSVMTGGTIEVVYKTQRELATGLDKAQLVVEVNNKLGCKKLQGSSKGEAGLTNFIIAETLNEVGQVSRHIGFRWYDEVFPNHDPVVCKSSYKYLRQLCNKLGILIFIVTHDPNAANYADHVLVIEKKGQGDNVIGTAFFAGETSPE